MVRFACLRIAFVLLICAAGSTGRLSAQELERATLDDGAVATLATPTALPAPVRSLPNTAEVGRARERRPTPLVPLYVSFCALQVLDSHSTWRAIDRGAVEANPVLRGVAGNQIGLVALKAAGTAGLIYASEKMWKRNRTASIVFMFAANSAMAWVVQTTIGRCTNLNRGASPLGLPDTRPRSPLRRLAPVAWLARFASLVSFSAQPCLAEAPVQFHTVQRRVTSIPLRRQASARPQAPRRRPRPDREYRGTRQCFLPRQSPGCAPGGPSPRCLMAQSGLASRDPLTSHPDSSGGCRRRGSPAAGLSRRRRASRRSPARSGRRTPAQEASAASAAAPSPRTVSGRWVMKKTSHRWRIISSRIRRTAVGSSGLSVVQKPGVPTGSRSRLLRSAAEYRRRCRHPGFLQLTGPTVFSSASSGNSGRIALPRPTDPLLPRERRMRSPRARRPYRTRFSAAFEKSCPLSGDQSVWQIRV